MLGVDWVSAIYPLARHSPEGKGMRNGERRRCKAEEADLRINDSFAGFRRNGVFKLIEHKVRVLKRDAAFFPAGKYRCFFKSPLPHYP